MNEWRRTIRRRQAARKRKKLAAIIARTVLEKSMTMPTKTLHVHLSRQLAGIDRKILDRIPAFLNDAAQPAKAADSTLKLAEIGSAGGLALLLDHYGYLHERGDVTYHCWQWIESTLVQRYSLPDWDLPVERERGIIEFLLGLRAAGITGQKWLIPILVNHPDKDERIIQILHGRGVQTIHDMEALLEDEVPMAIHEGAL